MLRVQVVGGELPYRVEFDKLKGAAMSPSRAVIAALSAGHKIPAGMRNRKDVASYVFGNYAANPDWVKLISILENDSFKEAILE